MKWRRRELLSNCRGGMEADVAVEQRRIFSRESRLQTAPFASDTSHAAIGTFAAIPGGSRRRR